MAVHAPSSIWKRSEKFSSLLNCRFDGFSKTYNVKPCQESTCLIIMPEKKAAKKLFRTGEKCPESGLYEHFCKNKGEKARIPLSKTETFPPCRTCGSVKWVLVIAA